MNGVEKVICLNAGFGLRFEVGKACLNSGMLKEGARGGFSLLVGKFAMLRPIRI